LALESLSAPKSSSGTRSHGSDGAVVETRDAAWLARIPWLALQCGNRCDRHFPFLHSRIPDQRVTNLVRSLQHHPRTTLRPALGNSNSPDGRNLVISAITEASPNYGATVELIYGTGIPGTESFQGFPFWSPIADPLLRNRRQAQKNRSGGWYGAIPLRHTIRDRRGFEGTWNVMAPFSLSAERALPLARFLT